MRRFFRIYHLLYCHLVAVLRALQHNRVNQVHIVLGLRHVGVYQVPDVLRRFQGSGGRFYVALVCRVLQHGFFVCQALFYASFQRGADRIGLLPGVGRDNFYAFVGQLAHFGQLQRFPCLGSKSAPGLKVLRDIYYQLRGAVHVHLLHRLR